MIDRIKTAIRAVSTQRAARRIRETSPLVMVDGPQVIFSQLCHRDVDAWLVAIKSLYPRIGSGGVCILNDGSLSVSDLLLLERHVPKIEIMGFDDVDMFGLPSGGTWERLAALTKISQSSFAIQMDADIVVLDEISEVLECLAADTGFVLTNHKRPGVVTLNEASEFTSSSEWSDSKHVQTLSEIAFARLPYAKSRRYSRSSSAFVGLPKGQVEIEELREFHSQMSHLLGDKWSEWGSEQVASNYIAANLPRLIELPCPKYANAVSHLPLEASVLLHFFGSVRYSSAHYQQSINAVIANYALEH